MERGRIIDISIVSAQIVQSIFVVPNGIPPRKISIRRLRIGPASGKIKVIIKMQTVDIVFGDDFRDGIDQKILNRRFPRVQYQFGVAFAQNNIFGMATGETDFRKAVQFLVFEGNQFFIGVSRSICFVRQNSAWGDAKGIEPALKKHSPFMGFFDHPFQRIPTGIYSVTGQKFAPGIQFRRIKSIIGRADLEKNRIHAIQFHPVQDSHKIILISFDGAFGYSRLFSDIDIENRGDPHPPHLRYRSLVEFGMVTCVEELRYVTFLPSTKSGSSSAAKVGTGYEENKKTKLKIIKKRAFSPLIHFFIIAFPF